MARQFNLQSLQEQRLENPPLERSTKAVNMIFIIGVSALLVGCGDNPAQITELPPRAIKYMKLEARAQKAIRQLAGIVRAGTSANVAFEIGGSVTNMVKKVGDSVKKDEIIASVDRKSIELQVKQSEYSLSQAKASLKDALAKFKQQEQLRKKRYTTQTAFDTAKANFENAKGQVGIAESQLRLARRDLGKADLKAPFDGTVSKKLVEVFEEVKAGSAIYTLQTEGDDKVEVSVPETLIGVVKVGDQVAVKFASLEGVRVPGLITEVSPQAGSGNAFPVTLRLAFSPKGLRPGMSAEITISFEGEATGKAFSVPVGALKPDVKEKQGTVFVYDAQSKTVRQRPVRVVGIKGNNPEIIGDIKVGDIIAVAGVGQMYDGMKVRLLDLKTVF